MSTDEDDSDDEVAMTGGEDRDKTANTAGGPDKTLMGDYQEFTKIMKCLMMELTEDARTSALMC